LADSLLSTLKATPDGLTRTELSGALGRNRSAADISQALRLLEELGLVGAKTEETGGRSAERWYATNHAVS
jgi:DNA-binding transcriptional regulator GbsR (MarR family)